VGSFLEPGASIGAIQVLRKTYRLVVPRGVKGVVVEVPGNVLVETVEYGQTLLRTAPGLEADGVDLTETGAEADSGDDGVPEGMVAVRSPTDGIFYRRPSPDQPSYVEDGVEVVRGRVLGLVEVMKCFNQIAYGTEPDTPERARVRKVLVEDSGEIKYDQVLFLLEPV
jgi:acetyl-CoA carboxylase biotin carboxyl carrier protein